MQLQDFLNDDYLFRYTTYQPLLDIVKSIIGPDIVAVNSMLINKPPDAHPDLSRYPIHQVEPLDSILRNMLKIFPLQDLHYLPFRPVNATVASWTAMESIGKEHGCLFTFPGSHKNEELYPHDYPKVMSKYMYIDYQNKLDGVETIFSSIQLKHFDIYIIITILQNSS